MAKDLRRGRRRLGGRTLPSMLSTGPFRPRCPCCPDTPTARPSVLPLFSSARSAGVTTTPTAQAPTIKHVRTRQHPDRPDSFRLGAGIASEGSSEQRNSRPHRVGLLHHPGDFLIPQPHSLQQPTWERYGRTPAELGCSDLSCQVVCKPEDP